MSLKRTNDMPPKKKRATRTADCCVVGCEERAKYLSRTFTERKPTHCQGHAEPRADFFEYSERLCEIQTCTQRSSFAPPGCDAVRCGVHKQAGDVNVVKKICECGRAKPFFGQPGTRSATRCGRCKKDGDVDLYNKRCIRCNTKQVAALIKGREDDDMNYCIACATTLGFDCINGRVAYCACGTQAIFDTPGTAVRSARFCGQCRDPALHVDVRHDSQMCQVCVTTRGSRLHDDGFLYCQGCFVKTFPDIPNARNYKTKERAVEDFLVERFSERLTMTFDRKVSRILPEAAAAGAATEAEAENACKSSGRKPDVLIDMGEWVVVVEVDENQHHQHSYKSSCETKRVMQIFDDAGRRPIVFIRFNPDGYKDAEGHSVRSPWTTDGRTGSVQHVPAENRTKWEDRLETLSDALTRAVAVRPERDVSWVYLFFDGY